MKLEFYLFCLFCFRIYNALSSVNIRLKMLIKVLPLEVIFPYIHTPENIKGAVANTAPAPKGLGDKAVRSFQDSWGGYGNSLVLGVEWVGVCVAKVGGTAD